VENAVFRIVQESLTNAHRRSKSSKIRIELVERDGQLRIEVRDWGVGFDPGQVAGTRLALPAKEPA
jgi:signal transduction histidine kinase